MLKLMNFALVIGTLGMAFLLYNLEHDTRSNERSIVQAKREMADHSEAIKLLNAEWSSLTRPERIQQLAQQHFQLQPIEPDQLVSLQELPQRLEMLSKLDHPKSKKDTIEDLLQKMQ
jgi:cell division protein FtsL